ncbi:MAG: hypothetical protein K0S18_15 [Anaerocolumna sp.]|nr:hypothetical protein [Anaerocolumna sp.]
MINIEKLIINKEEKDEMIILTKFLLKKQKISEQEYRRIIDVIGTYTNN